MKILRWLLGAIILSFMAAIVIYYPLPLIVTHGQVFADFVSRGFYVILFASMLCLWRIIQGPSTADRIVGVHILSVMMVGISALFALCSGHSWYIDVGIAWGLQAFICVLALSKNLEGQGLDD
ncbi:MAG: multiple resistance and pH regulation protein F [Candidatus Omnitrophica bacterium]|nr:multiple resistance and pH regulation protein F [Candidatus Omnitrophota bacterium]